MNDPTTNDPTTPERLQKLDERVDKIAETLARHTRSESW